MSNLKERLADMSALSQSRTPADALKCIMKLEAENKRLKSLVASDTDRIKKLEKELEYWRGDSAAGWDKCEEYRNKLAKAMLALDEAIYLLDPDDEDIAKETGLHRIVTICAELKGARG